MCQALGTLASDNATCPPPLMKSQRATREPLQSMLPDVVRQEWGRALDSQSEDLTWPQRTGKASWRKAGLGLEMWARARVHRDVCAIPKSGPHPGILGSHRRLEAEE